jgi:hypothetical protein
MQAAGDLLLGAGVMEREGGWNLLCKFFDNLGPIPHHLHQSDEFRQARQRRKSVDAWRSGTRANNGILEHADKSGDSPCPGSLATYEPQINSDVFAMFQSEVEGRIVDWSLLVKDVRPEFSHDLDFLVSMLDWDAT